LVETKAEHLGIPMEFSLDFSLVDAMVGTTARLKVVRKVGEKGATKIVN
jgi:hypothetical protein